MGSIVFLYVAIGIVCGICLTVSIVISALVRSNNIGQNEEKKAEYVDYTTFVYHASMTATARLTISMDIIRIESDPSISHRSL